MGRLAAAFADIEAQAAFQLFFRLFKQQNDRAETTLAAGIQVSELDFHRQADIAGHHVPQRVEVSAEPLVQRKLAREIMMKAGTSRDLFKIKLYFCHQTHSTRMKFL